MASFILKALAVAGVVLATPAIPAVAQDTAETEPAAADATTAVQPMRIANGTRFGSWTVNCEALAVNETACVLSQRLVRTADNVFLAELLAFWSGDGAKSYLAVRVPTGVYLPSGFAVRPADGAEQTPFVWQACQRDLCEALLEVDAESLATLEGAETLVAGYRPSLRAQPLVFRISLAGAREGLDALKTSMAKADSK